MDGVKFVDTDSKMNMTLAEIIKSGRAGKKPQRQVGKKATINNSTAAQRKQQQAKAATTNARAQRQKSMANKRGMTQSPQAQQQKPQPQRRGFTVRGRGAGKAVGGNVNFRKLRTRANANQKGQQGQGLSQGPVTRSNGRQANSLRNLKINVVNDANETRAQPRRVGLKQRNTPQRGTNAQRGNNRGNNRGNTRNIGGNTRNNRGNNIRSTGGNNMRSTGGNTRNNVGNNPNARSPNVAASRQLNQRRQANVVNKARGIPNNRTVLQDNGGGGNNRESTLNDRFSNSPQNQPRRVANNRQAGGRGAGRQQGSAKQQQQFNNAPTGRSSRRIVTG